MRNRPGSVILGDFACIILFGVHNIFEHFIKAHIHINWRSEDQLISIRVENGDLPYIPRLTHWTGNDIRSLFFGLFSKLIHTAIEAIQHLEAQRNTIASWGWDFPAIARQSDQQVCVFQSAEMDKERFTSRSGHGKDICKSQYFLVKLR